MRRAKQYLDDYREKMRAVNNADDLYGSLFNWQWEQFESKNSAHAQAIINRAFLREDKKAGWLVEGHPPTTAIGGMEGIVIVSANPHYDAARNQREQAIRIDSHRNRRFCESFFHDEFKEHTQQLEWWKKVARFGYHAMEGREHTLQVNDLWKRETNKKPLVRKNYGSDHLWRWAREHKKIGVVDLVPFHSSSDGITGLIKPASSDKKMAEDKRHLKQAMHQAAQETFRMVLRFRPRVVVVASKAGAEIADEVLRDPDSGFDRRADMVCKIEEPTEWKQLHQYHLHHFVSRISPSHCDTHVLTIASQLFSDQAGLGKVRTTELPRKIYKEIVRPSQMKPAAWSSDLTAAGQQCASPSKPTLHK